MPSGKFNNRRRWLSALAGVGASLMLLAPSALAAEEFGFADADVLTYDDAAQAVTQAGAHPFSAVARFNLNKTPTGSSLDSLKEVRVDLPPGLVGSPEAVPKCPADVFAAGADCPPGSQVGLAANDALAPGTASFTQGVYNLEPLKGTIAQFGFQIVGIPTIFTASLRPYDYGVTIHARNITSTAPITFSSVSLWGVPADAAHDPVRVAQPSGNCFGDQTDPFSPDPPCGGAAPEAALKPFFSMPSDCTAGPLPTTIAVSSWENPSVVDSTSVLSHDNNRPPKLVGISGCDQVEFNPTIQARATTPLADSPSGLDVSLHIPQGEDPNGLATAHMKKIVMDLPEGMTVNPSSANGLGACSPQQMGRTTAVGNPAAHFNGEPVSCPESSRLGNVESVSPAVNHPLPGAIYLAEQNNNPFNRLLALYLVVDDPQTGVRVKLAGKVEADPKTGQLRTIFDKNPQLPVEDLKVNLFTGPRASLRTPVACATYTTTTVITPWTTPEGADAKPKDSFPVSQGAGGGRCLSSEAEAPNKPSFDAGTVDPSAGAYSPFVLKLTREDGTQQLKSLDATLPKGLLGKLVGIPYCSDGDLAAAAAKSGRAEQASASCPSASQVGSVTVGAGAGSLPLYVSGKAFLAGPYKGAPLSMAIVTPAVAGPFDLGTVVVRTRLEVNPETAQIHAVSDDIPTILQGIPLDVRSIAVKLDKPNFTLNPTSCDRTQVLAGATALLGGTASVASPFQVGGCKALGFKPKLAFKLSGPTRRSAFPALRATLTARPGDANIGRAQVTLPKTQLLEQAHIRTICTRVQYAAKACPPGSVYGKARAWSPLLDEPLEGPVYLRSSNNPLPDLVASLDGQIHLDLVGRIDSVKARLRTTFDSVPDAPVSKFVLEMQGGKKGLLVNNTELCKAKPKADVKLDAQSGKAYDFNPLVKADCRKFKKKHKKHRGGGKKGKNHQGARR